MQALSDVDVIDTDPLVTEPLIQVSVPATSLPQIPSLAEHILLATEAMRRRSTVKAVSPPGPQPSARCSRCAEKVLERIRLGGADGVDGTALWHWVRDNFSAQAWTRSVLERALGRLIRLGLIDSILYRPARRRYVAYGRAYQ